MMMGFLGGWRNRAVVGAFASASAGGEWLRLCGELDSKLFFFSFFLPLSFFRIYGMDMDMNGLRI